MYQGRIQDLHGVGAASPGAAHFSACGAAYPFGKQRIHLPLDSLEFRGRHYDLTGRRYNLRGVHYDFIERHHDFNGEMRTSEGGTTISIFRGGTTISGEH